MKIIKVIWFDAEEYGEIGWNSIRAIKIYAKKPCPKMITVGHLLFDSESHVSVVSTIGDKETTKLEKIPKCMILSLEILEDSEKK